MEDVVSDKNEAPTETRNRGGSFCIAPGCSNAYYRMKVSGKMVHFHQLPMSKPEVLRRWLAALKRKGSPVGRGRRVCSEHFIPSNYIVEGAFEEDGRFVQRTTNRLKPDAVPSVFDFSGYSAGEMDRPAQTAANSASASHRRERALRRACIAEDQESEAADSQHLSFKSSDTENYTLNLDVEDEEDLSTDDDDDWHKKRKRRSCGECKACLCRKDCGTCDFCIDKPKFGGSNKKRQKCRLRQCQRQAMRHLLPSQMGQGEYGPDGTMLPGRPRPHYTYSRKSGLKKNKTPQVSLDFTDNEDDDSNLQAMSWSSEPVGGSKYNDMNVRNHQSSMQQLNYSNFGQRNGLPDRVQHISFHNNCQPEQLNRWDAERLPAGRDGPKHGEEEDEEEEEELPMITQIFSLADNPTGSGADGENQLMKLLHSLRSSVLPILWYAIMVEGPQLQLIQCSKQSSMADTMVLIDPGFCYQVTVQKQPLLPTHPLYDNYPQRLTSVTEVVNLLLGLEKYIVCQGLPPKQPLLHRDPIILERASTCDFLVKRNVTICFNCRALQGL